MSPCKIWNGPVNRQGYGTTKEGRRNVLAHRAAWAKSHGPIPRGLCVLHRCDNPPCVNVAHLFVGTLSDNATDRQRKGRGANTKLSKVAVLAMREANANGVGYARLATRFGVAKSTVAKAVKGIKWKWV